MSGAYTGRRAALLDHPGSVVGVVGVVVMCGCVLRLFLVAGFALGAWVPGLLDTGCSVGRVFFVSRSSWGSWGRWVPGVPGSVGSWFLGFPCVPGLPDFWVPGVPGPWGSWVPVVPGVPGVAGLLGCLVASVLAYPLSLINIS